MNPDMHFGDLAEAHLQQWARPDRDRHFAVVPVGAPETADVPVFADLDAVYEMETHALSDTTVELGGVLLGGQYQDADGRPFVLVTDSLRAQHYESTKGSFKFTHDTWQEITRQRNEFSPDLQMVGWYHTHPGWGVFLSGMDLFICEHFFNRRFDLALVIDPCRRERAFFQWREEAPRCVRQTDGFYLVTSRFRREELEAYATFLEGKYTVSTDPRLRGFAQSAPVPIVIRDNGPSWQWVAVLGSLGVQFVALALLAWRLLTPAPALSPPDAAQRLAAIEQAVTARAAAETRDAELNAKIEVLDAVVGQMPGGPQGLVASLAEKHSEIQDLKSSLRGHRALESELDGRLETLQADLRATQQRGEQLTAEVARLQTSLANLRQVNDRQLARLAELQGGSAESVSDASSGEEESPGPPWWQWSLLVAGGLAGLLAVGGAVAATLHWQKVREAPEEPAEETSDRANRS